MDANGVYTIRCRYNNKILVGSAVNIISKRWSKYKSELQRGIYKNKKLQADFNEYGISAFEWTIEQECDIKDLRKLEKQYIKMYEDLGYELYNIRDIHKLTVKKQAKSEKMSIAQREENNPRCRLSKENIIEILDMVQAGINRKDISAKFNIKSSYISRIGKDRWINTYKEWVNEKTGCTAIQPVQSVTAITL